MITAQDIFIQTRTGGGTRGEFPGDFVDTKLADHTVRPIIADVQVSSRKVSPHALAIDNHARKLYFSDIASRSIERVAIEGAVLEWDSFLPDVGLVYGMAIDERGEDDGGGFIYFSNTEEGTISRVKLSADSASEEEGYCVKKIETLLAGLENPIGVALDPHGTRLFFTLRAGSIRAVSRDGSQYFIGGDGTRDINADYEVRRLESGTRLDGIVVAASETSGEDPRERRLYWVEFGRAPAVKRSTLDGTRIESIVISSRDRQPQTLLWPRSLAFGKGNSSGLLFTEHLGALRRLPDSFGGVAETVAQAEAYHAAGAVRMMIEGARKQGLLDKYFTETSR